MIREDDAMRRLRAADPARNFDSSDQRSTSDSARMIDPATVGQGVGSADHARAAGSNLPSAAPEATGDAPMDFATQPPSDSGSIPDIEPAPDIEPTPDIKPSSDSESSSDDQVAPDVDPTLVTIRESPSVDPMVDTIMQRVRAQGDWSDFPESNTDGSAGVVSLRRRVWRVPAAAAALVMTLGAGYLWGSGGFDSMSAGGTAADSAAGDSDEVTLTSAGQEQAELAQEESAELAPADGAAQSPTDVPLDMVLVGGTFTAIGLSDVATTASVFAFEMPRILTEAVDDDTGGPQQWVDTLAAGLGVDRGEIVQSGLQWSSGENGSEQLSVWDDPRIPVRFTDPQHDPRRCASESAATNDSTGAASTPSGSAPACVTDSALVTPSEDEARLLAASRLRDLGVDTDALHWDAAQVTMEGLRLVTAVLPLSAQSDDGLLAALAPAEQAVQQWRIEVSSTGVASIEGNLAVASLIGEFEVISPQDAVRRLSDDRFIATVTTAADRPQGLGSGLVWGEDASGTVRWRAGASDADELLNWQVPHFDIVNAELVFTVQFPAPGEVIIAPSYRLTAADGTAFTVMALTEAALDLG